MNIAIYGGSFDPPHLGHLNVVLHALNNYDFLDEIHIIPCFQQSGKNLTNYIPRQRMCEETFGNLPKIVISGIERILGGESITLRTVRNTKLNNSSVEKIYLIVGSDTASKIHNWEGGKELIQEIDGLLIAPRTNISSTDVRRTYAESKDSLKVTNNTNEYIHRYRLYQ